MGAAFAKGKPELGDLFAPDMLGDDLDAWLAESYLLKRSFRTCALISGLIERRHPARRDGRQVTMSTDLIYDVLRSHEPDHILLRATWADAATASSNVARLSDMLIACLRARYLHQPLERISPLAVPVMLRYRKGNGRRRGCRGHPPRECRRSRP